MTRTLWLKISTLKNTYTMILREEVFSISTPPLYIYLRLKNKMRSEVPDLVPLSFWLIPRNSYETWLRHLYTNPGRIVHWYVLDIRLVSRLRSPWLLWLKKVYHFTVRLTFSTFPTHFLSLSLSTRNSTCLCLLCRPLFLLSNTDSPPRDLMVCTGCFLCWCLWYSWLRVLWGPR